MLKAPLKFKLKEDGEKPASLAPSIDKPLTGGKADTFKNWLDNPDPVTGALRALGGGTPYPEIDKAKEFIIPDIDALFNAIENRGGDGILKDRKALALTNVNLPGIPNDKQPLPVDTYNKIVALVRTLKTDDQLKIVNPTKTESATVAFLNNNWYVFKDLPKAVAKDVTVIVVKTDTLKLLYRKLHDHEVKTVNELIQNNKGGEPNKPTDRPAEYVGIAEDYYFMPLDINYILIGAEEQPAPGAPVQGQLSNIAEDEQPQETKPANLTLENTKSFVSLLAPEQKESLREGVKKIEEGEQKSIELKSDVITYTISVGMINNQLYAYANAFGNLGKEINKKWEEYHALVDKKPQQQDVVPVSHVTGAPTAKNQIISKQEIAELKVILAKLVKRPGDVLSDERARFNALAAMPGIPTKLQDKIDFYRASKSAKKTYESVVTFDSIFKQTLKRFE